MHQTDFTTIINHSELHRYILDHGTPATYRRGDIIGREGTVCPSVSVVVSGYFQFSVINSEGKVCITGFSLPGEIATDYVCSFLFGRPSFTSITAGCNTKVLQVSTGEAREFLNRTHPEFSASTSQILLVEAYRRYLDLHTKTPKERYVELFSRSHNRLSMIPLQEIASYLSVSRRQLQRIRRTIL